MRDSPLRRRMNGIIPNPSSNTIVNLTASGGNGEPYVFAHVSGSTLILGTSNNIIWDDYTNVTIGTHYCEVSVTSGSDIAYQTISVTYDPYPAFTCATEYSVTQGTVKQFVITLTASGGRGPFRFNLTSDIGDNFKPLGGANGDQLRLDGGNNLSVGDYVCQCSVTNFYNYTTTATFTVTVVPWWFSKVR